MSRKSTARGLIFLSLAACFILSGCDRDDSPQSQDTSTTRPGGFGEITGQVIYTGARPAPKTIPGSPMAQDESLVVGPDYGLKNVIVYLENPPTTGNGERENQRPPVVLDQINAVYVPHVVAVETGQVLRLKSSDNMMHNVHLQCAVNPDQNYGFAKPGTHDVTFDKPEAPFRVKCDVHPWMTAWVGVFDHPYFAVTDDQGHFAIPHVPSGTYTLDAWQEVLPQQQTKVTVRANQTKRVLLKFSPP